MVRLSSGELLFARDDPSNPPDAPPPAAEPAPAPAADEDDEATVEADWLDGADTRQAAARIQSMQRGKLARKDLWEQRQAAAQIQAIQRGKVSRRSRRTQLAEANPENHADVALVDAADAAAAFEQELMNGEMPEPEPEVELAPKKRTGRSGGGVMDRLTAPKYDEATLLAVKNKKKKRSKAIDGDFLSRLNKPTGGARAEAEGKTLSKGRVQFGAEAAQRRKTPPRKKNPQGAAGEKKKLPPRRFDGDGVRFDAVLMLF